MNSVKLLLPAEVIEELDLPYEGVRDTGAITLAVEGVAVLANLATLATLQPQAEALVTAIRNWRLRNREKPAVLTVEGANISLRIELPPNVDRAALLRQLEPLLNEEIR
ncbi:hypothetical protein [Micromonospora sp. HK10]|uniref:hypothetical protein n=1 Tax=Micromonospora sp. HK10 TaxID=1538294 RepID=UPI0006271579|nr:hypothetical protein [Micromonospora sp. HK10]KKK04974.1 hypothetical protein LQ51_16420 [Micromonospora sp. HK10]